MKVRDAEELYCPFIEELSNFYKNDADTYAILPNATKCLTTQCMAWQITEQFGRDEQGNIMFKHEPQDCEGYCKRLS